MKKHRNYNLGKKCVICSVLVTNYSTYCAKCRTVTTKGANNFNWTGGKPSCLVCKKKLTRYDAKYCGEHRAIDNTGSNNYQWKGDNVGYHGLHKWVERQLGKLKECSHCGTVDETKRYEWASVSREYKRIKDDWVRLCRKCHGQYDKGENWGIASAKYNLHK